MVILGLVSPITVILTRREVEWGAVCRGIGRQSNGKGGREGNGGDMGSFNKLIAHSINYLILLTVTDNIINQPGDVQPASKHNHG